MAKLNRFSNMTNNFFVSVFTVWMLFIHVGICLLVSVYFCFDDEEFNIYIYITVVMFVVKIIEI